MYVMMILFILIATSLILSAIAEVTVLRVVQTIYDKSPKLRIRGSGFDAPEDLSLELAAAGEANLLAGKDYSITADDDGDGLILKLLENRKWVNMAGRDPPVGLILSKVALKSSPTKNLLREPMAIAQVLPTPNVYADDQRVIYQSATNELRINGTGFVGAKKVDLYFDPPLYVEVGYEIVSEFPLETDEVVLRLRHQYKWREEPGPLLVIGVDTGGGPVKTNGDDGVLVAQVEENLDQHDITVDDTSEEQLIYHDEANLIISGEGFNPSGNQLRFSNGLLGKGINYTTVKTDESSISLRLTPGSFWRKNTDNLPGFLTLLAVNAGEGFVALGPVNSGKGKDIATVFERPKVFPSTKTKLFRTHSHELHIRGVGFPTAISKPQLKFNIPISIDTDYTIDVLDRTEIEITLNDGSSWGSVAGPLYVTAINTRGDEAGWVTFPGNGIQVAVISDDINGESTGGVTVIPMGLEVYKSILNQKVTITGSGFKQGISFEFNPALVAGTDYDMVIESENKVVLSLKTGKKWRNDAGLLLAKSVTVGGTKYQLAAGAGIRVAVVLEDPVITPASDKYHESQSKVIVISGKGFTTAEDTSIIIRPTSPGAYKILAVLEDTIRIQLKPDLDWLPSFLTLSGEDDKSIPLQVAGINTGAGEVTFAEPITVGLIVKDREGVVCDDSCEFAFDGICDDGSENNYYYSEEAYYSYYLDDDFGGYYSKGKKGGEYYGEFYDDYYMADDGYAVSACVQGTDCTDCGGVDAVVDYTKPLDKNSEEESCVNTCAYARDGICDDPRGANYCPLGTDCQDCGVVGYDNFTRSDDDGWWDDDDDYWTFNDGDFLDQTKGLEHNRHRVKGFHEDSEAGPAAMFLVVLEGMVYTVGAIFGAAALYLGFRWYHGQALPFAHVLNPDTLQTMSIHDLEMSKMKKMPITPDLTRT